MYRSAANTDRPVVQRRSHSFKNQVETTESHSRFVGHSGEGHPRSVGQSGFGTPSRLNERLIGIKQRLDADSMDYSGTGNMNGSQSSGTSSPEVLSPNKDTGGTANKNVYTTSKYVPLSQRRGGSFSTSDNIQRFEQGIKRTPSKENEEGLSKQREAFFKNDAPATKFDPASVNMVRDREREPATNGVVDKGVDKGVERPVKPEVRDRGDYQRDNRDREKENAVHPPPRAGPKPSRTSAKELDGYVGFANLPNQVYRKAVKKGFEFTLMVVGESGMGKSTLINSLFLTDLYNEHEYPGPSHRIKKSVNIDTAQVLLKEGGVTLRLTTVDTPGFGDAVDNSNCWQPVTDFIDNKYDEYLNQESHVNRKSNMSDNRVHACLYFIAPTGHGLKPLDVEFMKRLHEKVNIIPLISKADTLTPEECRNFKKTILNEIAQHKIKIYEFPDCDDEEENKLQKKLKERVPFAVVGSNTVIQVDSKKVRGRQYPWGIVQVENLEHNDFLALRNMLIRTHMQDLKDVTNNVHYENFRYSKLAVVTDGKVKNTGSKDPLTQMQDEKKEHVSKMKKMEAEMEQVFEMKVKEKKQKLKDSEADLQRRAEQMKKSLEQQEKELEQKRAQFEKEKESWEEQQRAEDMRRQSSMETLDGGKKPKDKKKGLF